MQQRYMDPLIGQRFLSVDPVTAYSPGGTFNQYWYANGNPLGVVDPDGRTGTKIHEGMTEQERQEVIEQRRRQQLASQQVWKESSGFFGNSGKIAGAIFGQGEHQYSNETWACNDLIMTGCTEEKMFLITALFIIPHQISLAGKFSRMKSGLCFLWDT